MISPQVTVACAETEETIPATTATDETKWYFILPVHGGMKYRVCKEGRRWIEQKQERENKQTKQPVVFLSTDAFRSLHLEYHGNRYRARLDYFGEPF